LKIFEALIDISALIDRNLTDLLLADEEAELVGTSPTSLAVAGISFFGAADFKVSFVSGVWGVGDGDERGGIKLSLDSNIPILVIDSWTRNDLIRFLGDLYGRRAGCSTSKQGRAMLWSSRQVPDRFVELMARKDNSISFSCT
jgi:hypothetical protein